MQPHKRPSLILFSVLSLALLSACGKKAEVKPPEQLTQVTVATSSTRDLPVTESAVGAETALGAALEYDPTHVAGGSFHVRLPFPSNVAAQLRPGQTVRLTAFGEEDKTVAGVIREIRPALNATSLSQDVIVQVKNAGHWRPTGSIRGEVTLGSHKGAVVVPEQAIVLRPAGDVVYTLENDIAHERKIKTGIARDGFIEVTEGLAKDTTVVVDGAALLSEGAKVKVRTAGGQAS
jgi:multidrug efflux pump subunit AcrA (membrane-fusion protein)